MTATLGVLIDKSQNRDAVHVAIAPVTADTSLVPGQHVGFVDGSQERVGPSPNLVGIVDPFLSSNVERGQRCWLLLYPNTVTSLRHEWTHPAFDTNKTKSEEWLRSLAERCGLSLGALIDHAETWIEYGDYYVELNRSVARDEFCDVDIEDFWRHFEAYTGKVVPENKREHFIGCSC